MAWLIGYMALGQTQARAAARQKVQCVISHLSSGEEGFGLADRSRTPTLEQGRATRQPRRLDCFND
jgi:hypothetical protein